MIKAQPFLLLLAALLAGCGTLLYSAPAERDAARRADAVYADCEAQRASGKLTSYQMVVFCAKPKVLQAYSENGYPFMDLVNLDLDARMAGAARIDHGQATKAEIDADLAELSRRIANEEQRRRLESTPFGASAPPEPLDQMLVGLDRLKPLPAPRSREPE